MRLLEMIAFRFWSVKDRSSRKTSASSSRTTIPESVGVFKPENTPVHTTSPSLSDLENIAEVLFASVSSA